LTEFCDAKNYIAKMRKNTQSCLKMIHVRNLKWSQSILLLVSCFLFWGWIFQLVQKKHMHKRKSVIHEKKEKRKLLAIVEELWQKQ
jgi:hypothetical protein